MTLKREDAERIDNLKFPKLKDGMSLREYIDATNDFSAMNAWSHNARQALEGLQHYVNELGQHIKEEDQQIVVDMYQRLSAMYWEMLEWNEYFKQVKSDMMYSNITIDPWMDNRYPPS